MVKTMHYSINVSSLFRLFEKVDHWINKEDQTDNDAKKRLDDANQVTQQYILIYRIFI